MKLLIVCGPMLLVAIILALVNLHVGGTSLVLTGLKEALRMTTGWILIIVIMFFLTGQANALIGQYMHEMKNLLSGVKGMFGVVFAGMVTPGTLTSAPIIKELWALKSNHGAIIVYFLASNLMNVQMLMLRAPMLGKDATIGMTIVGTVLTLVTALFFLLIRR